MEILTFKFKGNIPVDRAACIGVASSGNLEILVEPNDREEAEVTVTTKADGNRAVWSYLLERFFEEHPIQGRFDLNDYGAAPGVVQLRLLQAAKEAVHEE